MFRQMYQKIAVVQNNRVLNLHKIKFFCLYALSEIIFVAIDH